MTIKEIIVDHLRTFNHSSILFDLQEIYDTFPIFNHNSIRSALSRMVKKDELQRVDKGTYVYELKQYREYLHSKRVHDTNVDNPNKHSYDLDLEMTIIGTANIKLSNDEIDEVVNPALVEKSLEMIVGAGVFLLEESTDFLVTGSEWRYEYYEDYDPIWKVNVVLKTKSGKYELDDTIRIPANEFPSWWNNN